jgi:hypothetical protein
MEKLVTRLETLLEQLNEGAPEPKKALSPTELLAQKLRSALAQNAMGGRSSDDSKWRSAADTLKDAQASWQRLPPVPGDQAAALQQRFNTVARKIGDLVRKNQPSHGGGGKQGGGHQGGGGHKGGPSAGSGQAGRRDDKRPQRTPAGANA